MRLLFSLAFSCFTFIFLAQSYSFKDYSVAEGLAQTQVKAITEDVDGHLWIGTRGGLSRFNGGEFQNYTSADGLLNNHVTALYSERQGLWVGHEGGLSFMKGKDIKTWAFQSENKRVQVSGIAHFDGKIVLGSNGSGLYKVDRGKLFHISLETDDENRIRGLVTLGNKLYLATRQGLYLTDNLQQFSKVDAPMELNLTGIVQKNGLLYFSDINGKVYVHDPLQKQTRELFNMGAEVFIKSLFVDDKGAIWAAHLNGLNSFDVSSGNFELNSSNGLSFESMNLVYEDRNGTFWFGSDGAGLLRFGGKQIVHYNQNNAIPSNLVVASMQLNDRQMVFGSYDKGLLSYNDRQFSVLHDTKNIIWAVCKDKDRLWLGTDDGLLLLDKGKATRFYYEEGAPGFNVTCFYKAENGDIYVGGSDGLSIIKNGKVSLLSADFNSTLVGTIRAILSYNGQLVCAADGGLYTFSKGKFRRFLQHQVRSFSLALDSQNKLWVGSEDGLYCTDGKSLQRKFLSEQPASNFINFISSSKEYLFVGSNNGLYVLSQLEKGINARVQHFGIEEGVVNLETNINSSFIDKRDFLWFGTASGLVCFDTKYLQVMPKLKTNIQLKNLKINFQDTALSALGKLSIDGLPKHFSLPYNKNNLIIELDGIQLKNHNELKYSYWLEGLDEEWSPFFSNPTITLSNLPSNSYRLHIVCQNLAGERSKEIVLSFEIRQIFYKTWWFIALCILLVASLVFVYFRMRINREREERYKESLEFKTKLLALEQQSLNASMNRHFIFNSLNSIQYFINSQDKYSANKYLTNFAKLIRMNLDSSTENNNHVLLSEEIERLELYLSLEAMRFKDRFDYEINTHHLDLESVEVPAMIFQPFVENSIIHGVLPITDRKGKISINLHQHDNVIEVCIEDNGVGIDNSMQIKGSSNGDHKSKGMEITAKRISLLNKLSQEGYELEGPFQISDFDSSLNGTRVLIKIPVKNLS